MSPDDRQAQLDCARRGDSAALGDLLQAYRPYVRVIARAARQGCAPARLDDSDLIQDTLLLAHRAFGRFRGATIAEFAGWLRQLTLRTVGHALRAHLGTGKRDAGIEQPLGDADVLAVPDGSSPDGRAVQHERAAKIAVAIEELPDEMRQVILGRLLEGLPYVELAARLNKSEGALRVSYTRALRRLRELLGGDTSEPEA
ncbi:MAG TPA: sigma-70 family RNA polymerase sigma factor [Gemmataceae bacterium]|nr:sigma-70 family RNA polymerase sigma factor [Gemmataceae bacterium]